MKRTLHDFAAQAEAFVASRRGWSGGLRMDVTLPSSIPEFTTGIVDAAIYDRLGEPSLTLTGLAAIFNDLNGRAGETIRVASHAATTPAANLAIDVPATDDSLASSSFSFTMKEAVKSIAWYDRTAIQSTQNVSQLAGAAVGQSVESRIELDLGSALIAGRATAKDGLSAALTFDVFMEMKSKIPARLRRLGVNLVANDAAMNALYLDPIFRSAATFGSDEVLRTGQLSRPVAGVAPFVTDDGVLPSTVTVSGGTGPLAAMFATGLLGYGFQKNPSSEIERDARARLTRVVGTALHGEAVLDTAGVVVHRIGS